MAEYSGFFDSVGGDRKYSADDMGRLFDGIIVDGVVQGSGDGLRVYVQGSEMAVYIGTGNAYFNHRWYANTAPLKKPLNAAHPVNGRYDAIILELNLSRAGRYMRVSLVTGTPSANPTRPSMSTGPEIIQYPLAYIYVAPNAKFIQAANIEDARGHDRTPWLTGVASNITLDSLTTQLTGQFNDWFQTVKDQLQQGGGGNAALLADLKSRVEIIEPVSTNLNNLWNPTSIATSEANSSDLVPLITSTNQTHKTGLAAFRYELFDGVPTMHNTLWRGNYLGTTATGTHRSAISSGSFTDLWLGDYWTVNGVDYVIVSFNYWKGVNGITANHVVVMSRTSLGNFQFHTGTLTSEVSASIYAKAMTYKSALTTAFGTLLKPPTELTSAYASGLPSADTTVYNEVVIPSAPQLFGTLPTASVQNGASHNHSYPSGNRQFQACAINPELIFSAGGVWVQRPWSPGSAPYLNIQRGRVDYGTVTNNSGLRLVTAFGG